MNKFKQNLNDIGDVSEVFWTKLTFSPNVTNVNLIRFSEAGSAQNVVKHFLGRRCNYQSSLEPLIKSVKLILVNADFRF